MNPIQFVYQSIKILKQTRNEKLDLYIIGITVFLRFTAGYRTSVPGDNHCRRHSREQPHDRIY
jgi:hypothetical protein